MERRGKPLTPTISTFKAVLKGEMGRADRFCDLERIVALLERVPSGLQQKGWEEAIRILAEAGHAEQACDLVERAPAFGASANSVALYECVAVSCAKRKLSGRLRKLFGRCSQNGCCLLLTNTKHYLTSLCVPC